MCFIIDKIINTSVTTGVFRPVTSSTVNHLPTANTTVSASGILLV